MISRHKKERARLILTGVAFAAAVNIVVALVFIFPKIMGILALMVFVVMFVHLIYQAFIAKTE